MGKPRNKSTLQHPPPYGVFSGFVWFFLQVSCRSKERPPISISYAS
jgi:hypothetical protein